MWLWPCGPSSPQDLQGRNAEGQSGEKAVPEFWFNHCGLKTKFLKSEAVLRFPHPASWGCYEIRTQWKEKQCKGQSSQGLLPPVHRLLPPHPGEEMPSWEGGRSSCEAMTSRTVFPGIPISASKGFLGKLDREDKVGKRCLQHSPCP